MTIRHYLFAVGVMIAFFGGLILTVQAAERWSPWAMPVPTVTATPTSTPTSTSTATSTPTNTATPTTPPAVVGGDLSALRIRSGLTTNRSGCASDGNCWGYNAYWWPTNEIVMIPGEPRYKEVHERCHAHQARVIGRDLAPSEYDLHPWYATAEGQSFTAAVAGLPFPWTHSAVNGLEDFAWTCAYWYLDPERLVTVGGRERYDWVRRNLP